jgi:hypothetical protein
MSEVRQRRGVQTTTLIEGAKDTFKDESPQRQDVLEEFMKVMQKGFEPKLGMSFAAKRAKDELAADPTNMSKIGGLGMAYAKEGKWEQSMNVLLRGWKRVKEFKDPLSGFRFLCLLSQASFQMKKYRQAHAVLNDIQLPPDLPDVSASTYYVLQCQVCCANNEQQKGLKAFHNAIEGQDLIGAGAHWAVCIEQLTKVGLLEVTRSALMNRCANDKEKAKLEAMEKIFELRASYRREMQQPKFTSQAKSLLWVGGSVLALAGMYLFHLLEQESLKRLKMV